MHWLKSALQVDSSQSNLTVWFVQETDISHRKNTTNGVTSPFVRMIEN